MCFKNNKIGADNIFSKRRIIFFSFFCKSILSLVLFTSVASISFAQENPLKKLFDAGAYAFKQGDYKKAISLFEKTLELYPNLAQSYNYLGLCHKEIGSDSKNVAWLFERAIEIDPNYPDAYDNLSRVYYSLGEFDRAENKALKALELSPGLYSARLTLGWIYLLGKSMPDKAIFYFEQVVKERATAYAYLGLGVSYFMKGEKFKVLGYITSLREMNEEQLAGLLENIVRDNNFLSELKEGRPLLLPDRQKSALISDSFPNPKEFFPEIEEREDNTKVRIREENYSGAPENSSGNIPIKGNIKGADRIKTLQQNSAEIENNF